MTKHTAATQVKVRTCDYQRILNELLDNSLGNISNPCDQWLKSWAQANWAWVNGNPHNVLANEAFNAYLADAAQQQSDIESQAQEAYAACLAGNPVTPTAKTGLTLRVATRLASGKTTGTTATTSSTKSRPTARVTVSFSASDPDDDDDPTDCPAVPEAMFLQDDYGVLWLDAVGLDPQGNKNYRLEPEFETTWGGATACAQYDDYFCLGGDAYEPNVFTVRFTIWLMYKLTRTVSAGAAIPAGITVEPYDRQASGLSDDFTNYTGLYGTSPFRAKFVVGYENHDTGEIRVIDVPLSSTSIHGWFPLKPQGQSDGSTGAECYEPIPVPVPSSWGNWSVRVVCLGVEMSTASYPDGLNIYSSNQLMSAYTWPDGRLSNVPKWLRTSTPVVISPFLPEGIVKYQRDNVKIFYASQTCTLETLHVQVIEGMGMLMTLRFVNTSRFDLWYAYTPTGVTYGYSPMGGDSGYLVYHLPAFSDQVFYALHPLGTWKDWRSAALEAPVVYINPYWPTAPVEGVALDPAAAAGLCFDVRAGDAGATPVLVSNTQQSANLLPNWTASGVTQNPSVIGDTILCEVYPFNSLSYRLGTSDSLRTVVTHQLPDASLVRTPCEFTWAQLSAAIGLPNVDQLELDLDGTSYQLVSYFAIYSHEDAVSALVHHCDYWSSLEDFKTKLEAAIISLVDPSWVDPVPDDLGQPYLGFNCSTASLTRSTEWFEQRVDGVRSGIVPSVSTTGYPTRITVKV